MNYDVTESEIKRENLAEIYYVNELEGYKFPIINQTIEKYQWKYQELVAKLKRANYYTKYFIGGGIVTQLIYKGNKFVMPTILQRYAVNWYHMHLLHLGIDSNESTISQHYYWHNIRYNISNPRKVCISCQRNNNEA